MIKTTKMGPEGRKPIPWSKLQARPSRRTKPRSCRSGSWTTFTTHIWKKTIRQNWPRSPGWRKNKSLGGSRTTGRGSIKKWPLWPRRRTKIWVSILLQLIYWHLFWIIAYIREIVKMKFDKDMDQSLSGSCSDDSSLASHQVKKQGQVSKFANKVWGDETRGAN